MFNVTSVKDRLGVGEFAQRLRLAASMVDGAAADTDALRIVVTLIRAVVIVADVTRGLTATVDAGTQGGGGRGPHTG